MQRKKLSLNCSENLHHTQNTWQNYKEKTGKFYRRSFPTHFAFEFVLCNLSIFSHNCEMVAMVYSLFNYHAMLHIPLTRCYVTLTCSSAPSLVFLSLSCIRTVLFHSSSFHSPSERSLPHSFHLLWLQSHFCR